MQGKLETINKAVLEKQIVEKWLGAPYKNMGRDTSGIDCWGLGLRVYEMVGVKLFDMPEVEYGLNWAKQGGNYLVENYWRDWSKIESPEFMDAVLLSNVNGVAHHGGIILSGGKFIHATIYGVIISRLTDKGIAEKIEGFYRLKKLYE